MRSTRGLLRRVLAALLLSSTLSPIAPPAGAQVPTGADLAVIAVDPGTPAVGAERDITATVRNNGPSAVLGLNVVFYWNDEAHPVAGTLEQSRAQSPAPLGPQGTVTLTLAWEPTDLQAGAGSLLAVVDSSAEDPTPANDRGQLTVFVTRPGVRVTVSWTEAAVSVPPGAEHPLPFTVTNTGNVEADFVAELTSPDTPGWTARVSPAEARLLPGDRASFTLTVQPPAAALAGESVGEDEGLDLRVVEEGFADSELGVAHPPIPEIVVAAQRALALSVSGAEPADPSTAVVATLHVTNEGNMEELVTLGRSNTLGNAPRHWNLTFAPPALEIDAFEDGETAVQVDLPRNATAGEYEMVLLATGEGGASPPAQTAALPIRVLQVHDLEATVVASDLALRAAEPGRFEFEVANAGNGGDTVTLSSTAPGEGWTVEARPIDAELEPGERSPFELVVRPPAGAAVATGVGITASFTTAGGAERAQVSFPLTVDVLAGANIHLASVPATTRLDPATGVNLLLQLTNGGNRPGSATVEITTAEGWRAFANLASVEDLAAGQSQLLRITVTAPDGAQPGDAADITIAVTNEADGPEHRDIVRVVVGGPDLVVHLERAPDRTAAGTRESLVVRVESGGLQPAPASKLTLTAQGTRGTRPIAAWDLAAMGAGAIERRTVTWDTTGWAGIVLLTAAIDPDNAILEEDEGNNDETRSAFVSVVDLVVTTPPTMTVDPGQRVQLATPPFAIGIENRGNDRAPVAVRVVDEAGWIAFETTFELGADQARTVAITFTLPRPTGVLVNNVTVTATSGLAPDANWEGTWRIAVRDVAAPRVGPIELAEPPQWGVAASHLVPWDDGTGIRVGAVAVTAPDGTKSDILVRVAAGVVRFEWTPAAVGNHTLVALLTDLAGNAAPGLPVSAEVMPPPPPEILVPQRLRVAPGKLVPLDIRSLAPLAEVTADALGVRTTLDAPYRINTTGWYEGEERVTIEATDVLGQRTERELAILIDATPPALDLAESEPPRPSAGDDVHVRLVFAEGVENAALVLVTADGERIREDAGKLTETTWEASFVMPDQRITSVDVQATDLAGNAVLHEGALDLRTARAIPGPSVLFLLAGLAGIARAWRRA